MSKPTRFVVVPAGVANDLREFCKIVDSCSDGVAIYSTFKPVSGTLETVVDASCTPGWKHRVVTFSITRNFRGD